jgi:hypothetical protein
VCATPCHFVPTTLCQPIDLPHAPELPPEMGFTPPNIVITSSSSRLSDRATEGFGGADNADTG